MRSSPLAGPALSRLPPRTESSDQSSMKPSCQSIEPESFYDSSSAVVSKRRGYSTVPGALRGSGSRPQSLYTLSASDSPLPEWEIDPLQILIPPRTPKSQPRPRSFSGITSPFPHPVPILEEEAEWQIELDAAVGSSSLNSQHTSRSSSASELASPTHDHNSWYTANPYDVTPRFSRLGLSASTVVMPVSAKEHRRLSRNTGLSRMDGTSSTSKTPPSPTTKRFSILPSPSLRSLSAASTQSLHPQRHPLSRTLSTTSSSETSSTASTSQHKTLSPLSASASTPSLTRSGNSEDSVSTCETWPPTTPSIEPDVVLLTEESGDIGEVGNRNQIQYSGITVKNGSNKIRPRQISITIEQPRKPFYSVPQPQSQSQPSLPTTQPANHFPFRTPTFPKPVKKERHTLQNKLVRIGF